MIKLIILDVDGVLTDGKKYYNKDGVAVLKTFCDKDFTAIKKFKASNCTVIFLSGDENINKSIANNRNIPFFYTRGICKSTKLPELLEKYNTTSDETLFIGDDLFDVNIALKVKYRFCPNDACKEIKEISTILKNKGGDNCIQELYEILENTNLLPKYNLNDFYKYDEKEKF